MTRKIFGPKSITHLIYGILMMLPFLAIGTKCIYVSANKNAKDSYSNYISSTSSIVEGGSTLLDGNLYTISFIGGLYSGQVLNVLDGNTNIKDLYFPNDNFVVSNFSPSYEGSRTRLIVYDTNNNQHNCFNWELISPQFYFYSSNNTLNTFTHNYSVSITTYVVGTLDNAFDYAVSQVIDENNGFVPKNDFVGLLNGVFSENSNHLYLKLTNWYLNYALLISTIYILFLAMLWFVNLCRNILEKSMNIGNGVD